VRIEKLKQTFEIDATLVHFPLHPETPAEGRSMAEVYAGRNVDPEAMYTRMKRLMDEEGLPYGRRTHTYNSRLAQELGKWADTQPGGEALHDALYKAYFVDARNIGDPEILVERCWPSAASKKQSTPIGQNRTATVSPACRPLWQAVTAWSAPSPTKCSSNCSTRPAPNAACRPSALATLVN